MHEHYMRIIPIDPRLDSKILPWAFEVGAYGLCQQIPVGRHVIRQQRAVSLQIPY